MITTPSTTTRALPTRDKRKDRNFMLGLLRERAGGVRPSRSRWGAATAAPRGAYFSMYTSSKVSFRPIAVLTRFFTLLRYSVGNSMSTRKPLAISLTSVVCSVV
ncbi:hypothetical protein D9M70_642480 [compost metagenome]